MLEHLSESEQKEHYQEVKNRLWYPEGAVEEVEHLLPPPREYQWEPVSSAASWVIRLKQDALYAANRDRRIFVTDCITEVCKFYGISRKELISDRRHRSTVRPRQVSMYLAKKCTTATTVEIGRQHGNRDHTTVLWALRQIAKFLKTDRQLREEVDDLLRCLGATGGR